MNELILASKPLLPIVKKLWRPLRSICLKLYNLIRRPNLTISFEVKNFQFMSKDDTKETKRVIDIPYFAITNNKNKPVQIRADLICFNNMRYVQMYDSEILHQLYETVKAQEIPILNTEIIYQHYKKNWFEITQGRDIISIGPAQTKIFPVMPLGAAITNLRIEKQSSSIFGSKKKMIITLNTKGKNFEYGLCRVKVYEKYLNYLASYTARYKPSKYV